MAQSESPEPRDHQFADTEWSLVLQASRESKSSEASMASLCRRYWLPLYTYIRRRGFSHHDAEDLIQGFFAYVLQKGRLAQADPNRGRFRSFLLTALRNYVINQHHYASAEKRGGQAEVLPIHEIADHRLSALCEQNNFTPDQVFDRAWALSVLDIALRQLEASFVAEGKLAWFRRVQPFLEIGAKTEDYATIAGEFNMTKNSVAVAIHRLNRRYRELVRFTVAETVADRGDAEAELQHLLASLAS